MVCARIARMHTLRTLGLVLWFIWLLVYIVVIYGATIWPRLPAQARLWIAVRAHVFLLAALDGATFLQRALIEACGAVEKEAQRIQQPTAQDSTAEESNADE